jgi:hypothetical protein
MLKRGLYSKNKAELGFIVGSLGSMPAFSLKVFSRRFLLWFGNT